MSKQSDIVQRAYEDAIGGGNGGSVRDNTIAEIYNSLTINGVTSYFGSPMNMEEFVDGWLEEHGISDEAAEEDEAIDESLKYPTKSYSRKTTQHAIKRGSAVTAEDKFQDKIDSILREDGADLYDLVDDATDSVLHTDLLSESEADKRNGALKDKGEFFRWVKHGQ